MPRGRKKTTRPVETPVSTEITTDVSGTAPVETVGAVESRPLEAPVTPPANTTEEGNIVEGANPTPALRGRFRSWVTDSGHGYHRLTDEQEHRLVVLFDAKPADDVLTAVKGAGFQYQPDYDGLKQAWVRRNDFEGRLQVESIEKLIGTTPRRESTAR